MPPRHANIDPPAARGRSLSRTRGSSRPFPAQSTARYTAPDGDRDGSLARADDGSTTLDPKAALFTVE
ncbi:hypothetical protein ACFWSJ_25650 [Streptomyces niveus]|uniref:hypothetical protein n=1 Tax=Streptomyces niveus TaxID=193462 RepID=UPI00365652F4